MKRLKDLRALIERLLGSAAGRRVIAGTGIAIFSLLAGPLFAATEAGEHNLPHINWFEYGVAHHPPLGWLIVDFIIFTSALIFAARKPFKALLQKRHDDVKEAIATADAAHTKAQSFEKEYADKLLRVDTEVSALLEGAKRDGEQERDRIVAAANAYAERLRKDNGNAVEREELVAHQRLIHETAATVLSKASTILNDKLDDKAHAALIEQGIAELEAGKFSLGEELQ